MKRVCVTGAGGYIASWVVKLLLSKGYMVHGTVRDPCDEKKNGHLLKLENAKEGLKLFKADLLEYEDLCAAFASCIGVLHVASPVPGRHITNPQVELLDPAIIGTQNVLNACLNAKVEKVVVVSSASAVIANPEWPSDKEMDESCWTDVDYAKSTQQWYAVSKTVAEIEALEYAKRDDDLSVVTVCPSFVIGPMLQPTINTTSLLLLSYMKEEGRTKGDTMENNERPYLDVRDLSEAIILLYENPESKGRYICSTCSLKTKEFVAKMESLFPGYNYPKFFTEKSGFALSSKKLLNLGWSYRPLEETIIDTVKNYEELGLLAKGKPFPSTITF